MMWFSHPVIQVWPLDVAAGFVLGLIFIACDILHDWSKRRQ